MDDSAIGLAEPRSSLYEHSSTTVKPALLVGSSDNNLAQHSSNFNPDTQNADDRRYNYTEESPPEINSVAPQIMDDLSTSSGGVTFCHSSQNFSSSENLYDILGSLNQTSTSQYSRNTNEENHVSRNSVVIKPDNGSYTQSSMTSYGEASSIEYNDGTPANNLSYINRSNNLSTNQTFRDNFQLSNPLSLLSDVALGGEVPVSSNPLNSVNNLTFQTTSSRSTSSNSVVNNSPTYHNSRSRAISSTSYSTYKNNNSHNNPSDQEGKRKRLLDGSTNGKGRKSQRNSVNCSINWPAPLGDDSDLSDIEMTEPPQSINRHSRYQCHSSIDDAPTAPDLQLDWVSSSDSDSDTDSCIEVVCVQQKENEHRRHSVAVVDLTHESDEDFALAATELHASNSSLSTVSSVSTSNEYISTSGNSSIAGPSSCNHPVDNSSNHYLNHREPTGGGGTSTQFSTPICSCSHGTPMGSVGLNVTGNPSYNYDNHGSCYGACMNNHYTPHHHHHHHHSISSSSHHHHHHHYYAPDSSFYYSTIPNGTTPHPFLGPLSHANLRAPTATNATSYLSHMVSRLHPVHHRLWLNQQRSQEIQRRQMDPQAHIANRPRDPIFMPPASSRSHSELHHLQNPYIGQAVHDHLLDSLPTSEAVAATSTSGASAALSTNTSNSTIHQGRPGNMSNILASLPTDDEMRNVPIPNVPPLHPLQTPRRYLKLNICIINDLNNLRAMVGVRRDRRKEVDSWLIFVK